MRGPYLVAAGFVHRDAAHQNGEAQRVGGVVGQGGYRFQLPSGLVGALTLAPVVTFAGVRPAHGVEVVALLFGFADGRVGASDELEGGAVDSDVPFVASADVCWHAVQGGAKERIHQLVGAVALVLAVGFASRGELLGSGELLLVHRPRLTQFEDAVHGCAVAHVPLAVVAREVGEAKVFPHFGGGAGVEGGSDGAVASVTFVDVHDEQDEGRPEVQLRGAPGVGLPVLLVPRLNELCRTAFVDEAAVELDLLELPAVVLRSHS